MGYLAFRVPTTFTLDVELSNVTSGMIDVAGSLLLASEMDVGFAEGVLSTSVGILETSSICKAEMPQIRLLVFGTLRTLILL